MIRTMKGKFYVPITLWSNSANLGLVVGFLCIRKRVLGFRFFFFFFLGDPGAFIIKFFKFYVILYNVYISTITMFLQSRYFNNHDV